MSGTNGSATTMLLRVEVDETEFDAFVHRFNQFRDSFTINMRTMGGFGGGGGGFGGMGGGGGGNSLVPSGGGSGGYGGFQQMNNSLRMTQVNVTNINQSLSQMYAVVGNTTNSYNIQNRLLNRQATIVHGLGGMWRSISRDAKNVQDSFLSFLRWGGGALLGGGLALAGVGGAGALLGLDKLGGDVVNTRRAALQLGASYGGLRASRLDYGQYFNADSLLGNLASTRNDLSKRWIYGEAGISDAQLNSETTDQLSGPMLQWLRQQWKNSGGSKQVLDATGATSIMGMPDLRTIGTMGDAQFNQMLARQQRDTNTLGVNEGTQQGWTDFMRSLDLAGGKIETTFVDGLGPLTEPLSKLSGALADALGGLLSNTHIKDDIGDLAEGIGKAAKYLKSEDFEKDIHDFGDKIGGWGKQLEDLFSNLKSFNDWVHSNMGWLFKTPQQIETEQASKVQKFFTETSQHADDLLARHSDTAKLNIEKNIATNIGVNPDFQNSIFRIESGNNPNVGNSARGAIGVGQVMPATGRAYGDNDLTNFDQNVDAATHNMHEALTWAGGDPLLAGAYYNAGYGVNKDALDRFKSSHDISVLPPETQAYVLKLKSMGYDFGQNELGGRNDPNSYPTYGDGKPGPPAPPSDPATAYPTYNQAKKEAHDAEQAKKLTQGTSTAQEDTKRMGDLKHALKPYGTQHTVKPQHHHKQAMNIRIDNHTGNDISVSAGQLA